MHCNAKCNWFTKWLPRTIFEKASCYSNIQVSSPRPHKVISWIQLPRNIPIALRLVPLCNSLGLISHFISDFTFHVPHFTFHVLRFISNFTFHVPHFTFHVLSFISNFTFHVPHFHVLRFISDFTFHVQHFTFHVLRFISNFTFHVPHYIFHVFMFTFPIQCPFSQYNFNIAFLFQYRISIPMSQFNFNVTIFVLKFPISNFRLKFKLHFPEHISHLISNIPYMIFNFTFHIIHHTFSLPHFRSISHFNFATFVENVQFHRKRLLRHIVLTPNISKQWFY